MKQISGITPGAILLALGVLLAVGGCKTSSRWTFLRYGPTGKITTKVTVRTDPPGAEISLNGKFQGQAPIEIPIRYTYETKIYERKEYVPYPQFEQRELRTYPKNEFTVGAYQVGYREASEKLELKGEKATEITLKLRPLAK